MENKLKIAFVFAILATIAVPIPAVLVRGQEEKYFFDLTIILYTGVPPASEASCTLLAEEAAKIGINIDIVYMDRATWLPRVIGTNVSYETDGFDIVPSGVREIIDPGITLGGRHSRYLPPAGVNVVKVDSGQLDALLEEGAKELNQTRRKEIYQEALKLQYDNQWTLVLNYIKGFLVRNKRVENVPVELNRWLLNYAGQWTLADKTAADDTTLIYGMQMTIETLSPLFSVESGSVWTNNLVTESLVRYYSTNGTIIPVLAKSWDISSDGLNYTFYLRDNAYWHDGVKFTAEDVKFTYEAILNPDVGSWQRGKASNIKSIEVLDNYTVRFVMKEIDLSSLANIFSLQNGGGLAPKHIFEGVAPEDYVTHWSNTERIIGTGAYKFVQWAKDEYMEFEKHDQWWGGEPFIDHFFIKTIPDKTAILTALKAGEIDVLDIQVQFGQDDLDGLQADPDLNVQSKFTGGFNVLLVNGWHPILSNKYVRWALSYAFPREHYATDIVGLESTPASVYSAPTEWWYNPDLPMIPYDLDKAKEMMELAGYDYSLLEAEAGPDAMTLYGIPVAMLVVGLVVGAVAVYLLKRRP